MSTALMVMQRDPVRPQRDAFTACLQSFVNSSVQARKSADAFNSELPQQCQAEERAFREALIRTEMAARSTRADAEELASLEVDDARRNSRDAFVEPPQ